MLTLIRCPLHPHVTAVARKDPGHSAKSAYTLDPTKSEWADYAAVQAQCGNLSETSSHATCQGTFGHSRLSSLSHCGLSLAEKKWNWNARPDLHFKKKKKRRRGMNRQASPQNPRKRGKSHHHHHHHITTTTTMQRPCSF